MAPARHLPEGVHQHEIIVRCDQVLAQVKENAPNVKPTRLASHVGKPICVWGVVNIVHCLVLQDDGVIAEAEGILLSPERASQHKAR